MRIQRNQNLQELPDDFAHSGSDPHPQRLTIFHLVLGGSVNPY